MSDVWCVNCGGNVATDRFTLRFHREERPDKDLDLRLCDGCLAELLAEEWIECAGSRCLDHVESVC